MRRIIFLIALLTASFSISSGVPDGFKGIKWGSAQPPGLSAVESEGGMDGFIWDSEGIVLGEKNARINFFYYGSGLCRVHITWWPLGRDVFDRMVAQLQKEWGVPIEKNDKESPYSYGWTSESGKTKGMLLGLAEKKTGDVYTDVILNDIDCLRRAQGKTGM